MTIITGDCLEVMKAFPDNHFSGIVCDPPYSLGFMGKIWDASLPSIDIWEEALRIVKPGAFMLAFGGTRTYHRLTCAIEDAGWEIRDCLMWIYGSGFPKSHNHFGIEGYGTALKPAWEPIIMAMKPCEGTLKQNAEKWGQAGINIAGSRIATDELKEYSPGLHRGSMNDDGWKGRDQTKEAPTGRWPSNLLLDEEAAKMLDEQSGDRPGCKTPSNARCESKFRPNQGASQPQGPIYPDTGGASRFFYTAKTSSQERNEGLRGFEDKPAFDNPNGSMGGNMGSLSGPRKNNHPTVKPIDLMQYLIKLVSPPSGALILDPFAGSGSTIVAAKRLGIDAIGIEKDPEYAKIATARVNAAQVNVQEEMF